MQLIFHCARKNPYLCGLYRAIANYIKTNTIIIKRLINEKS